MSFKSKMIKLAHGLRHSWMLTQAISFQSQTLYRKLLYVFFFSHPNPFLPLLGDSDDPLIPRQYLVLPMQKETLVDGFETLTDPADLLASPLGWHNTGTVNTT
jgi:hypothetical protein